MIQHPQLRIPGPTPVPDRVQRAMAAPMINHRGPEFRALLPELETGLRWAFQTENDMLIFPASGTGGLESAVANIVSPAWRRPLAPMSLACRCPGAKPPIQKISTLC